MPSSPLNVFHGIGVSHHTAPLTVREKLVLTPVEAAAWLGQQRDALGEEAFRKRLLEGPGGDEATADAILNLLVEAGPENAQ